MCVETGFAVAGEFLQAIGRRRLRTLVFRFVEHPNRRQQLLHLPRNRALRIGALKIPAHHIRNPREISRTRWRHDHVGGSRAMRRHFRQTTLTDLQSVSLDAPIFKNPAFITLQDFSRQIVPEPIGRHDPFAPLTPTGQTSAGISGSTGGSTGIISTKPISATTTPVVLPRKNPTLRPSVRAPAQL